LPGLLPLFPIKVFGSLRLLLGGVLTGGRLGFGFISGLGLLSGTLGRLGLIGGLLRQCDFLGLKYLK
jgi:hypothetical protein